MLNYNDLIEKLIASQNLSRQEASDAMQLIMNGELNSVQIAAIATALRVKGESQDEMIGLIDAMRQGSIKVNCDAPNVVDTCGTGGDNLQTFNISTAAAFVAAGAGVVIAKHGNRAASSKSGSADVLEALGLNLDISKQQAEKALANLGISFLYARAHHPALKHAAVARQELSFRTIFNLIGPLTNPANTKIQLMGVFPDAPMLRVANVLSALGAQRAMVVRGLDGMDEITISGPTQVVELNNGVISEYQISPQDFGMEIAQIESICGGDAQQNATILNDIFAGTKGPDRDIVLLNAGAVIYLSGLASSHLRGVELAKQSIDTGAAANKLAALIALTNEKCDG